nr:hypothetical protein [Tanacetum cinerariifolium]
MNGRSQTLNGENIRDMLQIFPRLPGHKFKDPPFEEEILSFIRDLGYTGEIKVLTNVNVNYMHQPLRSFAAIIDKCLSGKTTGLDSLRLSHSKAYKEYYVIASRAEPPKEKTKYKKKADEPVTSLKSKTAFSSKGIRIKSKSKVAKLDKKKQPVKKTKAKCLAVLSVVALIEAEQIKLATKRSKKDFHISHASGSGDGVNTLSKVPDEQEQKTSGIDEGTSTMSSDDERIESDSDEIPKQNSTNKDQTEYEEEGVNKSVRTPDYELTDEEKLDDEETMDDEEDNEVIKADKPVQSSSVSSDFASKFLNLESPFPVDNEIASLMETSAPHATFDQRVFALESKIFELKQTNQFAKAVSSIPSIVDKYLTLKIKEAVNVDSTMKTIIKDQVKVQVSKIMPKIEKLDTQKNLYNALVESYNSDKDIITSYGDVVLLKRGRDYQDKDEYPSVGSDRGTKRKKSGKDAESSKDSRHAIRLRVHHGETTMNNPLIRRLPKLTAFNLLKGTFKSITELEYHFEECSKATIERPDWHNPENKPYSFDLRKPLSLIQDRRGCQIIPKNYFINKDLEYLKGGDSSRRYSTSVTKTKADTYELKWIKDLVPELWSPMVVNYDQHAYFGTPHWGPKHQSFYGYASTLTSSKNVYSRRRIIIVTRLTIMKKYDYGYLEEIEVRRDDQQLYKFKEDTDEEVNKQELEAHYSNMAKIQEVPTADSGADSEPLEQVQNDAGYNVFANDLQHSEQSKSVSNTCLVEANDSNVIPESPNICEDDIQNDQNDVKSDDERVAFAKLKLDVDENKMIQKQLKKANTTLAQELKECKAILAETTRNAIDLKYVKSLEKEIDELESDKAKFSNMYDVILQECVSKDVMCSYLISLSDLDALYELQCLYLHKVKECDCLAQKLSNQTDFVSKKVHSKILKRFANVEKHSISLDIALQKRKERVKNDIVWNEKASNVFRKEHEQYPKIQDLKARLQDKNISISELKKLIEKGKGKFVDTKFDRPSVVRQPNAQRNPKP